MENTEKREIQKLPTNFRIEQAKNYLRMHINRATSGFELSTEIISMILESLIMEEQRQRIALMAEQTDLLLNGKESEE